MSQQLFMRDDIIEFNNKLDSQCYNIKAYRKRKSKSKKLSGLATTDIALSQQNILRINRSMDKSQFGQVKGLQQKRIALTAAIKKRPQIIGHLRNFNKSVNIKSLTTSHKKQQSLLGEIPQTAKINYSNNTLFPNSNNINTERKSLHQNFINNKNNSQTHVQLLGVQTARTAKQLSSGSRNKYREVQKRVHKNGPLSEKSIQNWLDQILTEYCHQQQFDKSIQNAALKKMSIDRNSLLSQGIKPQYVNRVYKSLFVYSIGFNNLLKQLSGKNTHLKKTIWKVYAILLQFCSQGTFETMIGQIQRDKIHKLEGLRQEIEKRQRVIENNDQINQEKNAKIFKQLKQLKQQNTNLQNQKNVLTQDFKQAQQSFNQQVSIRLKFQNKINQIYGIHNELNNKHQRLYDDYHNKLQQATFLQQKLRQINDLYLITKQKLTRTNQQLLQQKRNNQTSNQMLSKYQLMRTRFQNSEIQLKNSKQDLLNIIKQKSRKISQLQVQLQNSQIMLKLSKSSYKQLQQQYKQSLQQNKKLHTTIRDQMNQLNQLFTQKKNFNQKHMSYVAQIQFLKNKDIQNKINIQKLKKQLKQQRNNNDNLFLEKTTLEKKVQTLDINLNDCYQNIQNMKKTKNLYQEELSYIKKRFQLHGQVVRQKDLQISTLTKSNQKLTKQNQQLITLNKSLDSKTSVLTQRLRSQQQINKKKYDKLKQQRDILFKQNSQHNAILQQRVTQLQKYMNLYDKQMLNLKNQRFERVNLDLRYKQSLQVMQSQNEHIKKLNIIISQNHQQIQQWQRKIRNCQYILKQKQHLFQVQRDSLKTYLQQARKQVTKKKMYLNPMIVQDLKGLLKRSMEKYDKLFIEYNQKIKQFKSTQLTLNTQIQTLKSSSQNNLIQQQQAFKKQIQQKQYQIQYQKQRCKHLQQKLQSIQKLLNKNKLNNQQNSLKQRQRKYLSTIKQKSQNIQKLLRQLQSAHDHNNTLIKRISEVQQIISLKNQEISEIQKKMTKLMQDSQQLQRLKGNRQKQTVSSKMEDYDQNLLAMNQNGLNNQNVNALSVNRQNSRSKKQRQPTARSNTKKLSSKDKDETQQRQGQQGENLNGKDNNSSYNKSKQKLGDKVVNPVWRNDLGKKMKNAFNYYAK